MLGTDWSKRISKIIAPVVWLQSGRACLPGQTDHSNTGIQSLLANKLVSPALRPPSSATKSLHPLVDSGRLVAISTLIALPFCHLCAWIHSLRIRTVLGPLLSYSFQVFKLSHVPPWPRRGKLLAPHRSLGFVFLLEARSSRCQP